jgi:hypothetical protein
LQEFYLGEPKRRSGQMGRTVAIGKQNFESLISGRFFYVDKTHFIKEWWESGDDITLITRPRRFGKTLNMSMLEYFFSNKYENRGDLFEGLDIWKYEEYRNLQGTYPVINVTFANIKKSDFESSCKTLQWIFSQVYGEHRYLLDSDKLSEYDKTDFRKILEPSENVDVNLLGMALNKLSGYLYKHYEKKPIILLDEYDTPMQEAYVGGFWEEITELFRGMFNAAFKTNPYLERAIMTGITRVSKESMFSDLNNLKVVTTTSERYATAFGFTEGEVFAAMDEMCLTEKDEVKRWYDGFVFGKTSDIYNPWSIINYLDTGKFEPYWANTSSNSLAGKLIREGEKNIKKDFEQLLRGNTIETKIDEQVVYGNLNGSSKAIWSLLMAGGYLRVVSVDARTGKYTLKLTNYEVKRMFEDIVSGWFEVDESNYNDFIEALLTGDVETMNDYMNEIALSTFSYFDTSGRDDEPERFYHGFVLGLMVDLRDRYIITSNRESGFGRYDIMMEPVDKEKNDGIIIEFKVLNKRREKNLQETLESALKQIEEKNYAQNLIDRGVKPDRIRKYGFAFEGKTVEIECR